MPSWEIVHDIKGRIRLKHNCLYQNKEYCSNLEQRVINETRIKSVTVNYLTGTCVIYYMENKISKSEILEILDTALKNIELSIQLNYSFKGHVKDFKNDSLSINMACLAISAISQYSVPALMPISVLLFLYSSIPSFKKAWEEISAKQYFSTEVLEAFIASCFAISGQILPGALMNCYSTLSHKLMDKSQEISHNIWLSSYENKVLADKSGGDIICLKTGELIPVDGIITEGAGIIDQHFLTGESLPVKRNIGDWVYASTVMIAGKICVRIERKDSETVSALIPKVIHHEDVIFKINYRDQFFIDRFVLPTMALSALAGISTGWQGALAVMSCNPGYPLSLISPLNIITSIHLCLQKGILVKDIKALENMSKVDIVLFDKNVIAECPDFYEGMLLMNQNKLLNIKVFADELSYDYKAQLIQLLQEEGKIVCFIGDGVCDAFLMKFANVSISIGSLANIAKDQAQVILMQKKIRNIHDFFNISNELNQNRTRNLKMIIFPSILCTLGVFTLGFGIWHSIIINNLSIFFSFLNNFYPLYNVINTYAERTIEMDVSVKDRCNLYIT
ncbi:MAG: hypothetical protein HQK79_17985 [Desulfobacterales bacterium]|nr:hypothetical protein [Desulfobacterales bacterium]